jgi:hypothetical protein
MKLLVELRKRNALLFWFGLYNFTGAIVCLVLMFIDNTQILGINGWIKPFKFFASVGLMVWTMGWLMYYLDNQKKVILYSLLLTISMFFENALIFLQSARATTSHFNIGTVTDIIIFNLMGIFILVFTIAAVLIIIAFFRQKTFSIPKQYLWSIRLGLIFFLFFSIEGGFMLSISKHTVGAPDGGPGLPLANWSTQLLPLFGYYIAKNTRQVQWFAGVYFIFTMFLLITALKGISLFV